MPVIINDFEVVAEPPQPEGDNEQQQQPEQALPSLLLKPQETEQVLRHLRERQARLRAD
jgi:hypothetical protein